MTDEIKEKIKKILEEKKNQIYVFDHWELDNDKTAKIICQLFSSPTLTEKSLELSKELEQLLLPHIKSMIPSKTKAGAPALAAIIAVKIEPLISARLAQAKHEGVKEERIKWIESLMKEDVMVADSKGLKGMVNKLEQEWAKEEWERILSKMQLEQCDTQTMAYFNDYYWIDKAEFEALRGKA